jgi:hypothetical protein
MLFFQGTKSRDESRGDHVRLEPAFGTAFRTTERLSKQFLGVSGCYLKADTNLPEYGFKKDFLNFEMFHRSKQIYTNFFQKKQAKIVKTISAQTKSIDLILISRHYPLI